MSNKKTMDDEYGDGSNHVVCNECGLCITCGDCVKYGCGEEVTVISPYELTEELAETTDVTPQYIDQLAREMEMERGEE